MSAAAEREMQRQQLLLAALQGGAAPGAWLRDGARAERGLAAYRANAGALAERALAAAFPTLQQLLGEDAFAGLARAFWQHHPPEAGDIALWGAALPAFVAGAQTLAEEPYLADVARLEWAVHACERARDAPPAHGLERLADTAPAELRLNLVPGTALVVSPHPVARIWLAHRSTAPDRFDAVREAFAAGEGDHARVARRGFGARVQCIAEGEAHFTAALLAGHSLAHALHSAGATFEFEPWLIHALQQQVVLEVVPCK